LLQVTEDGFEWPIHKNKKETKKWLNEVSKQVFFFF